MRVYRKPNGGKASALNYGLAYARGEIVICLDADTLFAPNTVAELVEPLHDPTVGAVAGNAKVGNRVNLVTRWQAIEYVTSQNLDRRAFSLLNCITVVPGAVGAWRKSLVQKAGGFSEDTLAEDQDLTLSIRRARILDRVRRRSDRLHRGARLTARTREAALPLVVRHAAVPVEASRARSSTRATARSASSRCRTCWSSRSFFPFLSPIADLMFVLSLWSAWVMREAARRDVRAHDLEQVLTYYAVFLIVDWVAAIVGVPARAGRGQVAHVADLPPALRVSAGDVLGGGALVRRRARGTGGGLGQAGAEGDGGAGDGDVEDVDRSLNAHPLMSDWRRPARASKAVKRGIDAHGIEHRIAREVVEKKCSPALETELERAECTVVIAESQPDKSL